MENHGNIESVDTIIIGAGQMGLSVGYYLARRGLRFVILEGNERIGDNWRRRWDSLRLFTPAAFDSLPGLRFPSHRHYFPTKDEMADYLEQYAARFDLPVRTGMKVERLWREGERFRVLAGDRCLEANQVVVAMASYRMPKVPDFAEQLDSEIVQLHSSEYRNPSQLQPGPLLVVGAGNSGAEIARELAARHKTWLVGRSTGQIPFRIDGWAGRHALVRFVLRVLFHRLLSLATPIGRKLRPKIVSKGGPLIRTKNKDLDAAGVQRLQGRVSGVRDGLPLLPDGNTLKVRNVIWCTGFRHEFPWIDLPGMAMEEPEQNRGEVPSQPGLYFVGLHFLYSLSSSMIHATARDAGYTAGLVEARAGASQSSSVPPAIRSPGPTNATLTAAGGGDRAEA